MSFQGINFTAQRLVPSDDGRLYSAIFNDGATEGCKLSYTGSNLTISTGYIIAGGRQMEVESPETYNINQAVSGYAQLVLRIDLTKTATLSVFNQIDVEVRYAAAVNGFASLLQEDINGNGSIYEMQLAIVSLGAGGITGIEADMRQATLKGGGAALNFEVIGSTTEPANPKENTIWVNTDTVIPEWVFSAIQPEKPVDGMVWVQTSTSSTSLFNALKKNNITVYPTACKQYVSGAWTNKTAKTYQGGKWVDWKITLYSIDDSVEWVTAGIRRSSGDDFAQELTLTYNANNLTITQTIGGATGIFRTPKKINLPKNGVIRFSGEVKTGTTAQRIAFCLWSNIGTYADDNLVAVKYPAANSVVTYANEAVLTVPADGEYYVGGWITSTDGSYIAATSIIAE